MSEKTDTAEAEKIPGVDAPPAKSGRGWPKGKKRGPKKTDAAEGSEAAPAKSGKKTAARMPVPPVWNRIIADLPYAVVPILQARTGLPMVEQLPMIDNASITIDRRTVTQMYESGRAAFDEWMLSFGGLKVHPALAYFGSVLATVGLSGYLAYLDVQKKAMELKIAEMMRQGIPMPSGVMPTPAGSVDDTTIVLNGVHVSAEVEASEDEMPPPVTAN